MATINHTCTDGQTIEIKTAIHHDSVYVTTVKNGKHIEGKPYRPTSKIALEALAKAGKSDGWLLGNYDIKIMLTAELAARINEMIATEQAALDSTPERQMEILISKRQHMVENIHINRRIAQNRCNREFENGDGTGLYVFAGDEYNAEADEISKKLAEFDEQHPEVSAEIKRRRDEETAKHIWD